MLFVPHPIKEEKNYNHLDNATLVKSKLFWQYLLEERDRLGFNLISLNYGMWETKQARSVDKYIQSCHGHIHLHFDDIGWENLKTMVSEDFESKTAERLKSALNAWNFPEQNNHFKNCRELEHNS